MRLRRPGPPATEISCLMTSPSFSFFLSFELGKSGIANEHIRVEVLLSIPECCRHHLQDNQNRVIRKDPTCC
jgi:hypothetical protein